jgi:membrane fusion protein (multidrug efflux system)
MIKRVLIVIVVLVVLFGGIFGFKFFQLQMMAEQMSRPMPPATVAATQVEAEQWRPVLRSVGSLVAVNGIGVTTEAPGIVSEINFESSEPVEAGTELIRLDDRVDRAALDALRAALRLARTQLKRNTELLSKKLVSQSNYDESKATLDAAQAKVAEQEQILYRKTIRAPFSGLLGIRAVDLGQYIEPGDHIVTLQALDPIYLDYTLPERQLNRLAEGQDVRIRLDALPGETFTGQITAIEPGIDEGTRSVKVRATFTNPDGRLRPGMFAEVESFGGGENKVLTIPRTAISFNTYGDFVYVILAGDGESLTVKRRQVVTDEIREGRVQVVSGLEAGERVVRAGLIKLRDGQPVKIDNSIVLKDAEVTHE